jgi:hypothetical protein
MNWKAIIVHVRSMVSAPKDPGAPPEQPAPISAMRVVFVACSIPVVATVTAVWAVLSIHSGHVQTIDMPTGVFFSSVVSSLALGKAYQSKCE